MESKNQPTADFIRIVVWNKQAEHCANFLSKGRLVAVQGRINTGSYEDKDGKKVYTTDITANQVQFLEFGDKQDTTNESTAPEGFNNVSDNGNPIPF